ncbi:MAG: RHS repeat-associated core domain-containing protein [Deltaproteobacteria bacterium]|nr:RHS repeat-associated core domain-containing protein [Deltaproteobacteria bacterium]
MAMMTPAGNTYCYHFNTIGSTVAMTNTAQTVVNSYAYTPFGTIANQVENTPQPFKFVGQHGVMAEPNGFYYMRARYYDPQVRRFISEDPLGFDGGDLNLYAYVGNNPINRTDPSGLDGLMQKMFGEDKFEPLPGAAERAEQIRNAPQTDYSSVSGPLIKYSAFLTGAAVATGTGNPQAGLWAAWGMESALSYLTGGPISDPKLGIELINPPCAK